MATKVYMEALSPTMEEGRLANWLKNEGDAVKEGDVLAEVETDKATMELVARGAGVLRKRMIGEGDTASVGTVIAVIAVADEDVSSLVGGAEVVGEQSASATEAPRQESKRVMMITVNTIAVSTAPIPLIIALLFQPGARRRSQWRTIPVCESVNEINTPIA